MFIFYLVLVQPWKTGNCPDMTAKIVDWDVKHQRKQTKTCMKQTDFAFLSNLY